ncbi:hypothetical protein HYALB_00006818 [Hymenoscyphus albidus]|uniref:NAD(P)-binding protein n=1 Tax=Hymenoscyphus albidus TaxID=595503 RepID=A0A9N9LN58_9HELO|nr:hypothetical protein HYALB_00006818 [Hymenoscyphus albidus]
MASYPPIPPQMGANFTETIHNDTYSAIDPTKFDYTGRYIFITGASKGVGLATGIAYARAGAKGIALSARSDLETAKQKVLEAAKSAGKSAPQVLTFKSDVTKWEDVAHAAAETKKEFGRLDILINNAGFTEHWLPVADTDSNDWWTSFEVNIRGVYFQTKALLPLMLKGGDKTFVNVASVGAHALIPGASGYQTSKAALLRFTEHFMVDYAQQGVLAYCINPGGIPTDLALRLPTTLHEWLVDTVEMASDSMVFLTAEKRDWLAGRYIDCKWDMLELMSKKDEIENTDKLRMRMVV